MEAAAVARLAAMRGIPFYCIKGVSDGFTDNLPDFNRFISPQGQFQTGSVAAFCSSHDHGTGLHSSGWARIVERLPKASRSSLLEFSR